MKVYESIAAAGVAIGLLAGCAAAPDEMPESSHGVPTEVVRDEVRQAYSEAESFWAKQGVSVAPSLALPRNETITCGTETLTPAKGREVIAAACFVTNTLVVWPEPLAEQVSKAVDKGAVTRTVVALIIKHEYGHFVQEEFNVLGHKELQPIIEPQADCMAGAAMRSVNPDAQASAKIYYDGIEVHLGRPDTKHGSAEQRLASFILGYAPQDNKNCDDVVPLE